VELRPRRAFLVVAEAAVDQIRVLAGFDDEGVKAEHQLGAAGLDQLRSSRSALARTTSGSKSGKELRRGKERPLDSRHRDELRIADAGVDCISSPRIAYAKGYAEVLVGAKRESNPLTSPCKLGSACCH